MRELDGRRHFNVVLASTKMLRQHDLNSNEPLKKGERRTLGENEVHLRTIPPFMIIKEIEFHMQESQADLMRKPGYSDFDFMTRKYKAFCEQSGKAIEDYVVGLRKDDAARSVEIDVLLQRYEKERQ